MKLPDKCEMPNCGKFFTVDNPGFVRGPMKVDGVLRDYFICKGCNDEAVKHIKMILDDMNKRAETAHVMAESVALKDLNID